MIEWILTHCCPEFEINIFLSFYPNVPKDQLTMSQSWFGWWLGVDVKSSLEPMPTHCQLTRAIIRMVCNWASMRLFYDFGYWQGFAIWSAAYCTKLTAMHGNVTKTSVQQYMMVVCLISPRLTKKLSESQESVTSCITKPLCNESTDQLFPHNMPWCARNLPGQIWPGSGTSWQVHRRINWEKFAEVSLSWCEQYNI